MFRTDLTEGLLLLEHSISKNKTKVGLMEWQDEIWSRWHWTDMSSKNLSWWWLKRKDWGVGKGSRRIAPVHREGIFSAARAFCKIFSELLCISSVFTVQLHVTLRKNIWIMYLNMVQNYVTEVMVKLFGLFCS